MPFSFRKHKSSATSPEITNLSRSLMYAQSEYAPSIAETTRTVDSKATTVVDSSRNEEATARSSMDSDTLAEDQSEGFRRPTTPPQGSRIIPWRSYHNLPEDHPVFRYPAAKREEMMKKGIDPVSRAEMDKEVYGKVYGKRGSKTKGFLSTPMLTNWGNMVYTGGRM